MDYHEQTKGEILSEKRKLEWGTYGTPVHKCIVTRGGFMIGIPLSIEPDLTEGAFSYKVVLHRHFGSVVGAKEWCQELVDRASDILCRTIENEDCYLPPHPRDAEEQKKFWQNLPWIGHTDTDEKIPRERES
jgi:hypothetical protein